MSKTFAQEILPLAYDADDVIRVGGTRVTLDSIVYAFRGGATAEEIVQQYPSLQLADIYQVIGYYLHQSGEIDDYLREREARAEEIRRRNETRFDPHGIRDRLLSRLDQPTR